MKDYSKKIVEGFRCPKCNGKAPDVSVITVHRSHTSKIFKSHNQKLLMITCTLCGYTEFYNLAVYEGLMERDKNESICSQEA